MKKPFIFFLLALFSVLFLMTACTRTEEFGGGLGMVGSEQKLKAGITGRVTDENHLPVKNAKVIASGKVTQTNINGEFVLQGLLMPKYYGYVKVEKDNYFTGSRTFTVTQANAMNHVEIQLIPKTIRGSFASHIGGTFTFDGVTLDFAPNTIMQANGLPYSGQVTLMAAHLNPEDPDFGFIMPGNLVGETPSGLRKGLESFGMLAAELEGASGEKLQIIKGETVGMKMTVAASQLAAAPASLPLWYFEEVQGMWKEEGEATLQNGQYVGSLGHFSMWNCDFPGNAINLEATFRDMNGNPVPNIEVVVNAVGMMYGGHGFTDNMGMISGGIPYNVPLLMTIKDDCGNAIYSQNLGPYTSNINLGTITISNGSLSTATYTGTAIDCNNAPLTNGFVVVTVGNQTSYHSLTNGAFSATVAGCTSNPSVSISAIDANTVIQSAPYQTTLTPGVQNIGNLTACGNLIPEYIQFTVDGIPYTALVNLSDSVTLTIQDIRGQTASLNQFITFTIDNSGGNYTLSNLWVSGVNIQTLASFTTTNTNVINWASAVGLYSDGNFSTTYLDASGNSHSLVVDYHIIRDF